MSELQPILDLVGHKLPWLMTFVGGARLLMKWVSGPVQTKLTARMAAAATSPDEQEERDWEAVLSARWYRGMSFAVDLVLSVKLPTLGELLKQKAESRKLKLESGKLTTDFADDADKTKQ